MRRGIWYGAMALILAWSAAEAAPVEAYGRLPAIEQVKISPDGNRLAFIQEIENKPKLVVFDLTASRVIAGLPIGENKPRAVSWAGNRHVLLTTSVTAHPMYIEGPQREWFAAFSLDVEARQITRLQPNEDRTMNVVMAPPEARIVDGHPTAIVVGIHFVNNHGVSMLFAQDLTTGRTRYLEKDSEDAHGWIVSEGGAAVAEVDYREFSKRWRLKVKHGGDWQEVYAVDAPIDLPKLEGLSADGTSLLIRSVEDEESQVRPLNMQTGAFGPALSSISNLAQILRDPATDRIIGGARLTDKIEYSFFDPEDQAKWNKAVALFPNADVKLESWSADHNRIIVHVSGYLDGDAYRMVDVPSGSTAAVGSAYDGVMPADVARVTAITYSAADGLKIPAYLTVPNGRPAKNLPLIVLPHGGPPERDMPGFDWWAQALASRGYAVLQPQFRGSGGWGKHLLFAGFGEWGRKMQTDLSDGVRDLVAKGIVNAKRVCIVGDSYGGYAALAGASFDATVYRCAISVSGISDLRKILEWEKVKYTGLSIRYWDRFLGVSSPNDHAIDAISPAKHTDSVIAPILLIHGRDDTVVPIQQSRMMADALKKAGKPVEFVELKGEDHWLSRSETRLQMLKASVDFLEKNNPPN